MNTIMSQGRSRLVVLSLMALLGMILILQATQAPSLKVGVPSFERELDSAALPSEIHPADRKFFTAAAEADRSVASAYLLAGVHPADRKFFTDQYDRAVSSAASVQAQAELVDSKLAAPGYIEAIAGLRKVETSASVHPADRKFFTGQYKVAESTATGTQAEYELVDSKLLAPGYIETITSMTQVETTGSIHPADQKFFTDWALWVAR